MMDFVFGFGSLMNSQTHDYNELYTAQLQGWRRHWCVVPGQKVAVLTVVPDTNKEVTGIIAGVPETSWEALDQRERDYTRVDVSDRVDFRSGGFDAKVQVYAVPAQSQLDQRLGAYILLSYLDVVIQGHIQVFGAATANSFFMETTGWDIEIFNDRKNPIYPRAQNLSQNELLNVDQCIDALGARWHESG